MTDTSDLVVFWAVVGARFFVPFIIPHYPLPGVIASLIIDAIDQTIFQTFTNLRLDNYQGYDKALDAYYLTITYLFTYRNWTNLSAFNLDNCFFYYRLFGVTAFELIQFRPLLIIFPNTFEYFFIFYSAVQLKWLPRRLNRRYLIGAAALIWIWIKLPHEYIIHIAQVDTTDWIKANILQAPSAGSNFGTILMSLGLILGLAVPLGLLFFFARRRIRQLPGADWNLSFFGDAGLVSEAEEHETRVPTRRSERFFSIALVEKIALVSLVGVIFGQVLLDIRATGIEISVGGAILITSSTVLSQWLTGSRIAPKFSSTKFMILTLINSVLILVIAMLLPSYDGSINLVNVIFFTLLFTVVMTMLTSFRQFHIGRFATANNAAHVPKA